MPYTNEYSSHSNWSAVLDGFLQLLQLATAAVSAKVLQDPDARAAMDGRGHVVAYAADEKVRHRSFHQFSQRIELISTEYRELHASFESLHTRLRYNSFDAHNLRWEQARELNLAHDCIEIDRFRHRITQHLTKCVILHAQAVSSVTEYLENIN